MKLRLVFISLLSLAFAACQSNPPTFRSPAGSREVATTDFTKTSTSGTLNPAWRKPPQEPFRLGPGDTMEIEVLGDGSTRATTTVGADGKIYYYLLAGMRVWGLTLPETKALIERGLTTYIRNPNVAISLQKVGSRRVWVMGRLNSPGIYPLNAPMTVLEAISRAGGLFTSRFSGTTEELADLYHSFLVRNGEKLPIDFNALLRKGDMSQNIYLKPDDFIYLPSALSKEVHVLGGVKTPKSVGFMDQVTLVSAISSAGGPAQGAQLSQVAIVRGSLNEPQIAIADFTAIVTGKQPDLKLEPRDIVYVPTATFGSIGRYADLIVETFVRTVSANEGGRAASPSASPVSVNVGIQ